MEQRIKGTTGLLALIGSPVGHSGSSFSIKLVINSLLDAATVTFPLYK